MCTCIRRRPWLTRPPGNPFRPITFIELFRYLRMFSILSRAACWSDTIMSNHGNQKKTTMKVQYIYNAAMVTIKSSLTMSPLSSSSEYLIMSFKRSWYLVILWTGFNRYEARGSWWPNSCWISKKKTDSASVTDCKSSSESGLFLQYSS